MKKKTLIIAEAGVNHNGDMALAKELVHAAAESGADAVKFQTFKAENLVSAKAKMAEYQEKNLRSKGGQFEMLKKLELGFDDHFELKSLCDSLNIEFLSTAFDLESFHFLNSEIKLRLFKVPSGEITNGPLILEMAKSGRPLILSTGMSTLEDIHNALAVMSYGLLLPEETPSSFGEVLEHFKGPHALNAVQKKVTILHCTTEYPAPLGEVNLLAMHQLRDKFGCRYGYSDHTEGITVPVAAAALGAEVIEKHFTLDQSMPGPDHKASLNPKELNTMVKGIREVDLALGIKEKIVGDSEKKNQEVARKGMWARKEIREGEPFSLENILIVRPQKGLSPMNFWDICTKSAPRKIKQGEVIEGQG